MFSIGINSVMEEGYYKTKESVQEYIKLAKGFNGIELIKKLEKELAANSQLLELGSGPGTDWRLLNEKFTVTGSDNSTEFINHLNTTNPDGVFIKLDAVTIDTNNRFDGIYSNKVLHHLKNNELAVSIKRQNEILNSNGIICHSFWKGKGSEIFKGLFVNYHTEQTLRTFFEEKFEILLIASYGEFEKNDSLLLIARKKN